MLFLLFQTVLVFPGEGSVTLEELHEKLGVSTDSQSQHVSGPIDNCHQDSDSRQPSISGQNCHRDSNCRLEGTDVNEVEHQLEVLDSNKSEMSVKSTATDNGGASLPIDRVVFIDSTWNQTRSICQDERLKGKHRSMK